MSTAVMSNAIFDCGELFKGSGTTKAITSKDIEPVLNSRGNSNLSSINNNSQSISENSVDDTNQTINEHVPLRRSYSSLVSLIEQHRKLDRSVSEPTSRYKTELCRPFEENGSCKYGDKCQFAHGYSELRNLARHPKYKTELCRTFHKIGFCPYGPRCHFVHNFEEARIHNLRVSAQLSQNSLNLVPLLQPAAASTTATSLNVNVSLLEQLVASPQIAAAVQHAATVTGPLSRANSLGLSQTAAVSLLHQHQHHHQRLQRSSSLQHQSNSRPKPLNLSPTFSLGSTADSISPSSSLSQSPTNSMASFFSDETIQPNTRTVISGNPFSYTKDFGLLSTRKSPSPQTVVDDLSSRTPSPLSPNTDSRLPVFNRISSTIADLNNLKI